MSPNHEEALFALALAKPAGETLRVSRRYVRRQHSVAPAASLRHKPDATLLLQSCQGLQQRQASLPPCLNAPRRITESLERLVQLYDAWGKTTQAAGWKLKLAAFQQAAKAVEKKGA